MDVGRSRPFPGGLGVHCILEFIKYILHVACNFSMSMQFKNSYGILIFSDENYMLSPYFGYVRVK